VTYAQQLTISSPEVVCSNEKLFYGYGKEYLDIDASPVVLKRNSTQMNVYISNWQGMNKYYGTLEQPFGTVVLPNHEAAVRNWSSPYEWYNVPQPTEVRYIANMYKITSTAGMPAGVNIGDLLGFVHVERGAVSVSTNFCDFFTECTYTIGLAYSPAGKNCGLKWTYLGDIIQPYQLKGPPNKPSLPIRPSVTPRACLLRRGFGGQAARAAPARLMAGW